MKRHYLVKKSHQHESFCYKKLQPSEEKLTNMIVVKSHNLVKKSH